MSDQQPALSMIDDIRARLNSRPETPETWVCEAISDAVSNAIADGQFMEHLRERGWVLVPVSTDVPPDAPVQWLHDGLDIAEEGWMDPVGRLEDLWRQAWLAGRLANPSEGAGDV